MAQTVDRSERATPDARCAVRHTNMTYTFPSYPTREGWEARAEHLRRRILTSAGLWPLPDKGPLSPRVTGHTERADYTIDNVYFESWPGFFVTGNLYRPRSKAGPFPGVLCPHGHWKQGRLANEEMGSIPGRCISLARQGYVAFSYDMIGYNDSGLQVQHKVEDDERTGFFDNPRGYLWGVNLLGLQLWNSIRVVDYLASLPEVDAQRIGCTGESGGGTQTFLLSAVEPRIRVAAPVNMISAHYQGGCLCENAPNLRLDTFNVEIGALMAPRPLFLVSATGDWTCNTPAVEYPAIRSIYELYDAADRVATHQVDAEHNYNRESREAVYGWFGKWLLGNESATPVKEQPFTVEPAERLLVFPNGKLPPHAVNGPQLVDEVIHAAQEQIRSLRPADSAGLQAYGALMGVSYRYALNAGQPPACELQVEATGSEERVSYRLERLTLSRRGSGDRIPALLFVPARPRGGALLVHPQGKAALMAGDGPGVLIAGLLAQGIMALAIDVWGAGELAALERDTGQDHFLTFNRSDGALRVQDILTALGYLATRTPTVHLVGFEVAGLWCLLARALAQGVSHTIVDAAQFDCENDEAWAAQLYIPGIRRAGDFRTAAALIAPGRLTVHNAAASFPTAWCRQVYGAAGAPEALRIEPGPLSSEAIASYLAGRG